MHGRLHEVTTQHNVDHLHRRDGVRLGCTLVPGQRVLVYRNLNKPGFYSVKDKKRGQVIAYFSSVTLENVKPHVGIGRLKVLEQKRRNVHAWIEGDFVNANTIPLATCPLSYYNPYKVERFVDSNGDPTVFEDYEYVTCYDRFVYLHSNS